MEEEKRIIRMAKFESIEDYYLAIDKNPPKKWIESKDEHEYIPIQHIDASLKLIYGRYNTENLQIFQFENEVIVAIELVVRNPVDGQIERYTGVASNPILQDAKTTVAEFKIKKKKNALEMGAPATLSSAISNAASKIGNLFGQNLGRAKSTPFYSLRAINVKK